MSAVATLSPATMAIHELSARIARVNATQVDQDLLFAEILPAPTENLAQVFEAMQAEGYVIGELMRFTPSRSRNHTEWHVPVAKGKWCAVLAFFVEEHAC